MVLAAVMMAAVFAGCHPGVKEDATQLMPLAKVKQGNYPQFQDRFDFKGLAASIDNSLAYFSRVPSDRMFAFGKERFSAAHMQASLESFKAFLDTQPSAAQLNKFIRSQYLVYGSSVNQDKNVLYTGYFEPTYRGSMAQSGQYPYPLYSKPDDLLQINLSQFSDKYKGHKRLVARVHPDQRQVVPYFSREEINSIDDFHKRAAPIAWLQNRVDRFFLEIQGSGRIALEDGEVMRVHYAGSNGNAYRSIGRYLIEKDEIPKEKMSMQAIRTWLEMHPERVDEVLHHNESLVFFRPEDGGPYGSLGVAVTAFRSIATDSRLFPKGALCFVQAQLPDRVNVNPIKEWKPASFFVLNQDTGGAIKGPGRADIFCGNDNYAAFTAGHMNVRGKLFFLVLKQ